MPERTPFICVYAGHPLDDDTVTWVDCPTCQAGQIEWDDSDDECPTCDGLTLVADADGADR